MNLISRRFEYGQNYTVSRLYVDGVYQCYILEDVVRAPGVKVAGATAIPAGKYTVIIDFSEHFQKDLPHILNVPMFDGVRLHAGNTDLDTEGCLLVGMGWGGGDNVSNSRVAFDALFPKLQKAIADEDEIILDIQDTK
jgi:hypothetical protein